jgi:hypothetical protein
MNDQAAFDQLEAAGLGGVEQIEALQIERFPVAGYRDNLLALHRMIPSEDRLALTNHRFCAEAINP